METQASYTQNETSGSLDARVRDYIDENTGFYMQKFERLKGRKFKLSWNWSTFFFKEYWFLYRKMYVETILIFLFSQIMIAVYPILAIILATVFGSPVIYFLAIILIVAIYLIIGMSGNYLYLRKLERLVAKEEGLREDQIEIQKAQKGGVSKISVFIGMVIILAANIILSFF